MEWERRDPKSDISIFQEVGISDYRTMENSG